MIKALFRKQMMEVFSWLYKDRKTGKLRSAKGIVGYVVVYLLLFGFLGVVFGAMAVMLCQPLLQAEMGWLYWCLMGLVAIFFGVFGSVFNTYSSLYQAKDNDILLSMPIPVAYILPVRLSGVYAMGLMYEMIVMLPAMIVWWIVAPFTVLGTLHVLLIPVVLSLLILALSAVLGWVVAIVMTKVKHKNFLTVLLSLAFIVGYYYLYGKAYSLLQTFLENAAQFGNKIKIALYPFYQMGLAAEGSILSMLLFTGMVCLPTAIVIWLLSGNFLKLATTNRGAGKTVYKEQSSARVSSVRAALLRKELRRFTGSANYMLNCGMGMLLMPVVAVLLLWKAETLRSLSSLLSANDMALLAIGAMCLMASMNILTAPSVSLEGKNFWILQSFPVSGKQALEAKLSMHLLLTLIPAVLPILVLEWLVRPGLLCAIALPLITVLFTALIAEIGLLCNLKMPNLHWSNETIPIKQSMPVMIAMFGGWGAVIALSGGYLLLRNFVGAGGYAVCVAVLLAAADAVLLRWLTGKGARIFEQLQ